jgi:hypothetical protein
MPLPDALASATGTANTRVRETTTTALMIQPPRSVTLELTLCKSGETLVRDRDTTKPDFASIISVRTVPVGTGRPAGVGPFAVKVPRIVTTYTELSAHGFRSEDR